MKKALVLLLILAVAGGAFAKGNSQAAAAADDEKGQFSWSGGVDIGGKIDFVDGGAKNAVIEPDGNTKGHTDLAYTLGGLKLGMGFETNYWDADDGYDITAAKIGLSAAYTGDRWGAKVAMPFITIDRTAEDDGTGVSLPNDQYRPQFLAYNPDTLWGYYTFLDNTLRFDVSYAGGGNGVWAVSDLVKDDFFDVWDRIDDGGWGGGAQFTYTGIKNLSFGAIFPFAFDGTGLFVDDTLLSSTLGAAYNNGTLGASFMLALNPAYRYERDAIGDVVLDADGDPVLTYKKYAFADMHIGFKYAINDAMSVKADAAIGFGGNTDMGDDVFAAIGVNFDYSKDPFGFGLTFKFHDMTNSNYANEDWWGSALEINPYASYQITDALKAKLGITLGMGVGLYNKKTDNTKIPNGIFGNANGFATKNAYLTIEPGLAWAVGAGASMNFGYCVKMNLDSKYKDAGYTDKLLDHNVTMGFKWSW